MIIAGTEHAASIEDIDEGTTRKKVTEETRMVLSETNNGSQKALYEWTLGVAAFFDIRPVPGGPLERPKRLTSSRSFFKHGPKSIYTEQTLEKSKGPSGSTVRSNSQPSFFDMEAGPNFI